MAIDPNNPFNFVYFSNQNYWGTAQLSGTGDQTTHGATHSYSSISAGVFNTADNCGNNPATGANSPYNYGQSPSGYTGPGNSYVAPVSGPFGYGANGGSGQNGPDQSGDVTVINTAVAFNPTFAADNIFDGGGAIGLYGRSRGTGFSIGVMGQSSIGCGMLGLATDENSQSLGIGVVGRSMGGEETELQGPDELMASPICVLGQSALGTGVRGHGGPLLAILFARNLIINMPADEGVQTINLAQGATGSPTSANIVTSPPSSDGMFGLSPASTQAFFDPNPSLTVGTEISFEYTLNNAAGTSQPATVTIVIATELSGPFVLPTEPIAVSPIGGVFSSGQLASQQIPLSGGSGKAKGAVLQQVSQGPVAQLQLVPFVSLSDKNAPKLPIAGEIGDLFLCVIQTQQVVGTDSPSEPAAQLWICTGYVRDKAGAAALPRWQPVQMGVSPLAGGTPIPLTATPWA
jgi:hypothetical protein